MFHSTTFQCLPLAGPIRCSRPAAFSCAICLSTALELRPGCSAIFLAEIWGLFRIMAIIFSELFFFPGVTSAGTRAKVIRRPAWLYHSSDAGMCCCIYKKIHKILRCHHKTFRTRISTGKGLGDSRLCLWVPFEFPGGQRPGCFFNIVDFFSLKPTADLTPFTG